MTRQDIDNLLSNWRTGLLKIAELNREGKDYREYATNFIKGIYAYDTEEVLFKPTLASKAMFRGTLEGAISYFIAGDPNFSEDNGFALKDWTDLKFENTGYILDDNISLVMGNKNLTAGDGSTTIANYSMAFKRNDKGELQIVLHHSSLPFTG